MKLLVVFSLLASTNTFAHWFAPKNNKKIPAYSRVKKINGSRQITEKEFNAVLDKVEEILAPVVKERGGILVVNREWQDGTVNAYAHREGDEYHITMFGGLARHEETTPDGFALVACHEIGHHIGGSPRKPARWASNEGQSDYWATLKCAKRLWEKDENIVVMNERAELQRKLKFRKQLDYDLINEYAKKSCDKAYESRTKRDAEGAALCLRAAMGGLSLARLLADLGGSNMPEFDTPDPSKVSSTNHAHPAAQCRLDTYFNGSLCALSYSDEVNSDDPFPGTCNRIENHKVGLRPLCWFQPKDYSRRHHDNPARRSRPSERHY
ncbi:MAG: hypothetical protein H6621_05505 [Halobacteriovoraceae bacterium]|nr:hypothetical protein [Halobacteriovoraceae bacterium]